MKNFIHIHDYSYYLDNWNYLLNTLHKKNTTSVNDHLLIYVLTYNMAGNIINESDFKLLFNNIEKYDLIVINVQECERSIPQSFFNDKKDIWENILLKFFNEDYKLVCFNNLNSLHISIFIRKHLYNNISNIKTGYIKNGFLNLIANKGALAISFKYFNKNFLFINSHLSSGQNGFESRNNEFERINKDLKINDNNYDNYMTISNYFDITIWSGDFNYRLYYRNSNVVIDLINNGKIAQLRKKDQLLSEIVCNNLKFDDFEEGTIYFKPTYKFYLKKNENNLDNSIYNKYDESRIPSWCDRIIYKSKNIYDLQLLKYDSINNIYISDHKPVFAIFKININKKLTKDLPKIKNNRFLSCSII